MVRNEIKELQRMGPPPSDEELVQSQQVSLVERYQVLLHSIGEPVTDEEAVILTGIFGDDDFFGPYWTLLHLIETAPHWPIDECWQNVGNEWIAMLKDRAERWRVAGYPVRPFYTKAGLPDPRTTLESQVDAAPTSPTKKS